MPHDPALSAEKREWLKKAASDLSCAKHALTASPPLLATLSTHEVPPLPNKKDRYDS